MFAEIIPLIKLPRKLSSFDYQVPQEMINKIKIGHIVAVYFRNQKILGVVINIKQTPDVKVKRLQKIEELTKDILPTNLLKLVSYTTNSYLSSASIIYKNILPHKLKKKVSQKYADVINKTLSITSENVENVKTILSNYLKNEKTSFLYDNNPKETLAVYIKLIKRELENKNQILLLVPALEDINFIAPYLEQYFKKNIIIWNGSLSKGVRYFDWQKILQGEPAIILGTRSSIFLPFTKLSLAIIHNNSSEDHKQRDMNPRYDARELLTYLQSIAKNNLLINDIMPNINIYNKILQNKIIELNKPTERKEFILADLKKEIANSRLISYPVFEMIKDGLMEQQKIILFINRSDSDKIIICKNCNETLKCPRCNKSVYIDKMQYFCYICKISLPIPEKCPACQMSQFKSLKSGMKNIAKYLEREFSNAKILIINKQNQSFSKDFNIMLTSDFFWKNTLHNIGDIKIYGSAILDFDFYTIRQEYNQKETAFQIFHRFLNFTQNYKSRAIIQTTNPENEIFFKPSAFLTKELNERKNAEYPPFKKLIKIICKASDDEKVEKESIDLYNNLKNNNFFPLPPLSPFIKIRGKNHLKHLILKEDLKKDLSKLKILIPDNYQIDVDPINIY